VIRDCVFCDDRILQTFGEITELSINEIMLELIRRDMVLAIVESRSRRACGWDVRQMINERESFRHRAAINFGHRRLLPDGNRKTGRMRVGFQNRDAIVDR